MTDNSNKFIRNGPSARPSGKARIFYDPRQYNTAVSLGSSTLYTTLYKPVNCAYERVIASTPGLVSWWTMDKLDTDLPIGTPTTGFRPSSGAACLSVKAGTVTNVAGLLPGSTGRAAKLTSNAYLEIGDYFIGTSNIEIGTWELWVKLGAIPSDSALMGAWLSNAGWLLGLGTGGNMYLNIGNSQIYSASGALATVGKLYHVVAILGGTQQDYYSRLYVNGIQVASGLNNSSQSVGMTRVIQVGTYANAAGGKFDATYQHLAIYSRMLQPAEVKQHYEAGFARI